MFTRSSSAINIWARAYCKASGAAKPPTSAAGINANVQGLTSKCVKPTKGPVGPGASHDSPNYKVPEYFSFNRFSFAEAEVEMAKYRIPQPSALK